VIRIWFEPGHDRPRHLYHLAHRQAVSVDRRLPILELFLAQSDLPPEPPPSTIQSRPGKLSAAGKAIATTYNGTAWLGGAQRHIRARSGDLGYLLSVEGSGEFEIHTSGEIVHRGAGENPPATEPATEQATMLATEVVLGPALLLQLAWRGRFALHASALCRHGQAIAFIGDSGAGKSTVAASHAQGDNARSDWHRLADDILPVVWPPNDTANSTGDALHGKIHVAPHFPQLKLPVNQQYPRSAPPLRPLSAVYLLIPPPANGSLKGPRIEALSRKEALLIMVRHTVASKLFDARLQALLFAALARASTELPVYRLLYPHTATALAKALERVEEGLVGSL